MHAGDALWWLHGSISMIERMYPTNIQVSHLVGEIRRCAGIIGAHISVPAPSAVDLSNIIERVQDDMPGEPTSASTSTDQQQTGRSNYSDPEIIEAARTFVDAMVTSDLFTWADMTADINNRLQDVDAFLTYKQARALLNIARRGEYDDGSDFMDRMEDELPEVVATMKLWADQA